LGATFDNDPVTCNATSTADQYLCVSPSFHKRVGSTFFEVTHLFEEAYNGPVASTTVSR
jgi:hypothetical protein